MFARRVVACVVVILGLLAVASMSASTWNRATYFTFSGPVRLPGVVLPPGTYTFELPSANDVRLVRVSDRNRTKVYLTAFTRIVDRPASAKLDPAIVFGETAPAAPPSIKVWYAHGERIGRQFVY